MKQMSFQSSDMNGFRKAERTQLGSEVKALGQWLPRKLHGRTLA